MSSLSDLFYEMIRGEFFFGVWKVMRDTPLHNYQILTKRPERIAELEHFHNESPYPAALR